MTDLVSVHAGGTILSVHPIVIGLNYRHQVRRLSQYLSLILFHPVSAAIESIFFFDLSSIIRTAGIESATHAAL